MGKDIEALVQCAADYHRFCHPASQNDQLNTDGDDLSVFELDQIAAAAQFPLKDPLKSKDTP